MDSYKLRLNFKTLKLEEKNVGFLCRRRGSSCNRGFPRNIHWREMRDETKVGLQNVWQQAEFAKITQTSVPFCEPHLACVICFFITFLFNNTQYVMRQYNAACETETVKNLLFTCTEKQWRHFRFVAGTAVWQSTVQGFPGCLGTSESWPIQWTVNGLQSTSSWEAKKQNKK